MYFLFKDSKKVIDRYRSILFEDCLQNFNAITFEDKLKVW